MEASSYHTPVLLEETLSYLLTDPNGTYLDCTLGGGGHAESILRRLRGGRLIGFDRDADAIGSATGRLRPFGDLFTAVHTPFGEYPQHLGRLGVESVTGILMDLGVSSHQVDDARRGFSFQKDGPLDMRMDAGSGRTAAEVVNDSTDDELRRILSEFGEEPRAKRIARAIVAARPIVRTEHLRAVVEAVTTQPDRTKTLARVFQAIRLEVNNELDELRSALSAVPQYLTPGGRVVVLSYHSLEDRIVKQFFSAQSARFDHGVSKFLPVRPLAPTLRVVTRRPVTASNAEISSNPRARSARLRAAERL